MATDRPEGPQQESRATDDAAPELDDAAVAGTEPDALPPALEGRSRAPNVAKPFRGSTKPDAAIEALAKQVEAACADDLERFHYDRNKGLPWASKPHPATVRAVRADPAAWRARMGDLALRLSGRRDAKGYLDRTPVAELHVVISALEALVPWSERALRPLMTRHWSFWGVQEFHQRVTDVIAASMGDEKFLELALGARVPGDRGFGLPWPVDRATAQVLARIAAKDAQGAAWIRQRLFDKAGRGEMLHIRGGTRSIAGVVAIVLPADPVASVVRFPRPNTKAKELGDFRAAFQQLLHDSHPYVRAHAVDALQGDGVTPPSALRGPLLSTFLSEEPRIRAYATRLSPFILRGVDEFIPTLNEMLATDDARMAADAATALVRLAPLRGDADMARLVGRILGRAGPDTRVRLVKDLTLFRMTTREETDLLGRQLGDKDATVRVAVVESLGQLATLHGLENEAGDLRDVHDLIDRARRDPDKRVAEMATAWHDEIQLEKKAAADKRKPFGGRASEDK